MSCAGRSFGDLGAKLVPRTPLAQQLVDPADSVLGPLSNAPRAGLSCGFPDRLCTYGDLIAGAFDVPAGQDAVQFFVANFPSIWGQAIHAYEATLVPDRTPYDLGTLTASQVKGLQRFRQKCAVCHAEPEFSDATVRLITARGGPSAAQTAGEALGADQGFHNIGVAPTALDHGRKASPGGTYHDAVGNDGAFKTPALRNVKLTAPYMHNGALATLGNVLDFYDSVLVQVANAEIDRRAVGAGVGGDRAAVIDFLENGLTDCRVEHELAPFDHPALALPNGPALPARGKAGDGTACP